MPASDPTAASAVLLPTLRDHGRRQMAIDAWLLRRADRPMLRLYHWSAPTLSLGRHQRHWPAHWPSLAEELDLPVVRRPSGGRAVLHAGGLTYAVVWPRAPRPAAEAYRAISLWLMDAFASLGIPLEPGGGWQRHQPSHCFGTATPADLVEAGGVKRIGSAQRWHGADLLQHGEILLEPPGDLWQALFGSPAPELRPLPVPVEALEHRLVTLAQGRLWSDRLLPQGWPDQEGAPWGSAWGDTSPLVTIPWAT
ncbi:lipoate--protein ligase family protein [Synechococcus sp. RSCCF101]|uniref:lipoate--protein ligase family protein n=1 Tax=Synechococcus sp. RSCCF101 TaxID=2511069 RepID=UPI001CD9FD6C|nr:lipoate--protein ligase family protein [Synechococcus sp. RSCCF101]